MEQKVKYTRLPQNQGILGSPPELKQRSEWKNEFIPVFSLFSKSGSHIIDFLKTNKKTTYLGLLTMVMCR